MVTYAFQTLFLDFLINLVLILLIVLLKNLNMIDWKIGKFMMI